jgi:uridine kinase
MIQNLIKGANKNTEEAEKTQPVEHAEQKAKEQTTVQKEAPVSGENVQTQQISKEAPETTTTSVRRFMTPQLSADVSQFTGLSLRLEDGKKKALSNFPLRQGKPFVIGVCGGNCAGKMDLVNYLVQHWGEKRCTTLKQENFYYTPPAKGALEDYNYDDPEATDWKYMEDALDALLYHKKSFHTPIYNFRLNKRDLKTEELWPNPIIIVEGLLIFHIDGIRDRLDLKIFLDTDDDIRLSRRIMKGHMKLGRNVDSIVERYKKFVKPCHEIYVLPSRKFADIIIPNFGSSVCEELDAFNKSKENKDEKSKDQPKVNLALELMVEQVKTHLEELGLARVF